MPASTSTPSRTYMPASTSTPTGTPIGPPPIKITIVNSGAYVYWVYSGLSWSAHTLPLINGPAEYLPIVLR